MEWDILFFLVTIFFAIWIVVVAINKDIAMRKNLKNGAPLNTVEESGVLGDIKHVQRGSGSEE